MTYHALCAALRRVMAQMPGRVLSLKVTPAQYAVLTAPPYVASAHPARFRGARLVVTR